MTELSFLLNLLLNHKLPKAVKELLSERIKEVEQNLSKSGGIPRPISSVPLTPSSVPQAQSTLDAMARHAASAPMDPGMLPPQQLPPEMPPIPVQNVAQTPAAMQAMNSRHQAIAAALAGKTDKETGRPRKW